MFALLRSAFAFAALALCAAPSAVPPVIPAKPALWVVRDADTTVYLFGSVHVLKPGLGWFDGKVKRAFDSSEALVLELVKPTPDDMAALVQKLGMSSGGPTLTERLPAADRPKLEAAFAGLGWPKGSYDRFDPWLAATTLWIAPLQKLGYDDSDGVESVLSDAATRVGKPILGLETAEQQLGYFDNLDEPAQVALLTGALDSLDELPQVIDKTVAAWSAGDPDTLAHLVNDDLKESPELVQKLLVERNRRWADWVAWRMHRPGTVFIAVGAGHLAGPDSVQQDLAKLGLRAVRVRD